MIFMLYEIKDKYYILVDGKYVKVDFVTKGNEVEVKADKKEVIEKNNNVIAKPIAFNEEFKKNIVNKKEKTYFSSRNESKELDIFGNKNKRK